MWKRVRKELTARMCELPRPALMPNWRVENPQVARESWEVMGGWAEGLGQPLGHLPNVALPVVETC